LDTLTTVIKDHWGDIASVVGVVVSLIGFAITIWGVLRSKTAAQKAKEEVSNVRETISRLDTAMEFSAALTMMDEIKRLHRAAAWIMLPDRYSALKRLLISIRTTNLDLADEHQAVLQGAIQHFTDLEKKVERALASNGSPPNVATVNEIVSAQLDKMSEVISAIRREVGE